jgi:aspartyl-tRNA(Asn)/glutamyl-tRNA(Gln) amidotransferase subunit C
MDLTFPPPGYNTNMPLSIKEVKHIAKLARLELTLEEEERFRLQLSDILEYFRKLKQLKTTDDKAYTGALLANSILRPDEIVPSLTTDEILKNTALKENEQFEVPPIFGEQDE